MSPTRAPRALRDRAPRERGIALLLAFGLALALVALAAAPKPWSGGVVAKRAAGADLKPVDYAITYGWIALAANAALLAGLLATRRRWMRHGPVPHLEELDPPARRPGPLWTALVLAAAVTGGALAAPRLSQSLWDDEIYNLHKSIDGYWKRSGDGLWKYRRADWIQTLWYYRMPNNHVPHSILARLSLRGWRALGSGREHRVDETALRLPAFVAGVAAIGAGGLLLWWIGFPTAGVALAWLMALHPWVLRYTSEARGYSMVLLLVSVHAGMLLWVLARGSWGRWLCYGAVQVLLLWVDPATLQLLAITNGLGLAALLWLHRGGAALPVQLARFAVVQLGGAAVWIQLMAPNLPQLADYLKLDKATGTVGLRWVQDVASYLFVGMPYRRPQSLGAHYPQLLDPTRDAVPLAYVAGAAIASALVAVGTLRLLRRGGVRALLAPVLLLPGPVTYLTARLQGTFLWEWYLIFMLPSWGALIALGLTWPLDRARGSAARLLSGAAVLGALVAFAVATAPARHTLRTRSLQPRKESVLLTRSSLDPTAEGQDRILTASFCVPPTHYDAGVAIVSDVDELRSLMERADREALPLYVNLGWLSSARKREPELTQLVLRPELFDEIAVLHGFEPRLSRHVFRYRGSRPGSAGPGPG